MRRHFLFFAAVTILMAGVFFALVYFAVWNPERSMGFFNAFAHLDRYIIEEDWRQAEGLFATIKSGWLQAKNPMVLNVGFDSLLEFERALLRLERALEQEDVLTARLELATVKVIWAEFTSV